MSKGVESPTLGFSKPARVDDAVAAVDISLSKEEMDYLEEPYVVHELVGPIGRPGEKPIAGSIDELHAAAPRALRRRTWA